MPYLALYLLGPPRIELDGEPVWISRRKVVALLAYLAMTGTPHSRDALATLLWPERSQSRARAYLRRALSELNRAVGEGFLAIDRETAGVDPDAELWLDVDEFRERLTAGETHDHPPDDLCPDCVPLLTEAVALYRDDFLAGFTLRDSPGFDEWQFFQTDELRDELASVLERLMQWYDGQGEYAAAIHHVRRRLALDPLNERAHRKLMELYAQAGHHAAALRQYQECARILEEELDVAPSRATARLYQQIRDGAFPPAASLSPAPGLEKTLPPFLSGTPVAVEEPVFVARERQLARLEAHLERALAGQGQVIFVTGEAGQGKTALIQAFAGQAQQAHPDLVVASGYCNAYTGIGDPYLPFRELLELLTGDVEAKWAAGAMTREHARRLWHALPRTAHALVVDGPDLIDTFVHGGSLVERATTYASPSEPWLDRLAVLVERKAATAGPATTRQDDFFEQYSGVLQGVARQVPLLLVVDDLQWADPGSISLLFHLGRRLAHAGGRILILGAYRPEEVALGRPAADAGQWERHPLEPLVHEFQRDWGNIEVALDRAEGRRLLEALLDSQPNRLGSEFRETLYRQTLGHPLFTIELVRGMQERGDLIADTDGAWVAGPALDWETLPPRVEAVIAERIDRLTEPLKNVLRAASVEGESFTAEVVARAQAVDDGEVVACLSGELDRRHRLVRAQGLLRAAAQRLSRYRFRHILFQKYLYNSLDGVERAHLHEKVGIALERLHGERTTEMAAIAPQLAWHFDQAGMLDEAIVYLQQAGDRAVRMSANQEAIAHFTRGIELLKTLLDTPERARRELALQLALPVPIIATRSWGAPEAGRAYARARELCQEIGDTAQLLQIMYGERAFRQARAEHRPALELAEQFYSLAKRVEDPLQVMLGHSELAFPLLMVGEFTDSLAHVEQLMAFYDPQSHGSLAFLFGQDPAVASLSFAIYDLWFLGYPDQALTRGQEALALARELDHPFTLHFALVFKGRLHRWRHEVQAVHEIAEEMLRLGAEYGLELAETEGRMNAAWVSFQGGRHEKGIVQYRLGLAGWQATGMGLHLPEFLAVLAKMHGEAGQPEEGLRTLDKALGKVHKSGEVYYEAELYRLRGEMLLMPEVGDAPGAEASFNKAIEVARRQDAKMLELRATTSLARLWQSQGERTQAHQILAEIYGWFTEGFGTRDLVEGRSLLEALADQ